MISKSEVVFAVSDAEVEAILARTESGAGYVTKAEADRLSLSWPPPKGWRKKLRRRPKTGPTIDRSAQKLAEREDVDRQLATIEAAALAAGLKFRASKFNSKKRGGYNWHLLFDDGFGRRVLEWWPTSGTWWCKLDKTRGKADDYRAVIDLALAKAGRRASPDIATMDRHLDAILGR